MKQLTLKVTGVISSSGHTLVNLDLVKPDVETLALKVQKAAGKLGVEYFTDAPNTFEEGDLYVLTLSKVDPAQVVLTSSVAEPIVTPEASAPAEAPVSTPALVSPVVVTKTPDDTTAKQDALIKSDEQKIIGDVEKLEKDRNPEKAVVPTAPASSSTSTATTPSGTSSSPTTDGVVAPETPAPVVTPTPVVLASVVPPTTPPPDAAGLSS